MRETLISIIIPTLNEEHYISSILKYIQSQSIDSFEVIVSDCNSKDTTIRVAKKQFPDVITTMQKKHSPGAARNAGARIASGDVLLFVDADVRIGHQFVDTLHKHLIDSGSDIVYPRFRSDGKSIGGWLHVLIINVWLMFYRRITRHKGIGGVIMCTKSAYDIIGGFREIHASEDVIFYETAVSKNFKITQCKTAKAYLSSRRSKGRGFLKTVFEDFRFFKILRLKRSYDRYK